MHRTRLRETWYARQPIKVCIPRVENQGMLNGDRRDPEIVGGDRCACFFETGVKRRIVMGGGIAAVSHTHAGLLEKLAKDAHLGITSFDRLGTDSDFRQDNERHHEQCSLLKGIDHRRFARAEVDESVRINQDSHFQSSGFTLSCSSRAARQASVEAFVVRPTIWRRVR